MPTYDYVCESCGHRLEVVHGIQGRGPEACPVCGGVMRKAVVAPAVHFKGSGWAKKDRGVAASTKAAAKAAAGEGSATPSGGEGGSASSTKDAAVTAGSTDGSGNEASSGRRTTTAASAGEKD